MLIGLLAPSLSVAQSSVEQLPLDRILDQKKLKHQKKKLLQEIKLKKKKKLVKKSKRTSQNCIEIREVGFLKDTKMSKKVKNKLTKEIINRCIFNDQIGDLIKNITNYYIGRGFTNTRVYFKDYDDNGGKLTLLVSEGVISLIKLNNIKQKKQIKEPDGVLDKKDVKIENSVFSKSQVFFAFPTARGNIFNIDDIEQGLFNINRLRSNNAVIDSRPGKRYGESDVIVKNYKRSNSLELGVNYDNSGSKSTGVYNTTYSINKDNLFRVNDNVGFSQIKSPRSETNMFNISIPFGYYTLRYSDSSNQYTSISSGIKVEGRSTNHDLSLSKLLFRNKEHEINLNTNLNFRNQFRKEDSVVRLKSQRLSTFRVGGDYKVRLKNNLTIYAGLDYSRGIRIHSAFNDKEEYGSRITKDSPRAQFEKFSYNLSLYKVLGRYFKYSLQANGQHSSDSLFSSELIYVGGSRYTVRGLSYDGISGSKGGYVRNDLNIDLSSILGKYNAANNQEKHNKLFGGTIAILKNIDPFIFYDHGFTRAIVRSDEEEKNEYMSGVGFGVRLHGKYLSGEISYAKSLSAPQYVIENNEYQNSAIYFGINSRYWF